MPNEGVRRLTVTAVPGIPDIQPGDDLNAIIPNTLETQDLVPEAGDIFVVAQKIVSKAEGCYRDLREVSPSPRARELAAAVNKDPRLVELILAESAEVLRHAPGVLIVVHRLGYVLANAGIDASNLDRGDDVVLLLPEDPDRWCRDFRAAVNARFGADVGVIVADSLGRAWRNGTVGTALGAAGLAALADLRGRADLQGRALRVTEIGLGDELAAAASILMGQADEGLPVCLIRGVPYPAADGSGQDLIRARERDLFR
jgi:coenzyme F420-0:L-glutamate ligase/coenzyme F420-1:gamma-L-glutamate ligase